MCIEEGSGVTGTYWGGLDGRASIAGCAVKRETCKLDVICRLSAFSNMFCMPCSVKTYGGRPR
jgi:hypothetical protein